VYADIKKLKEVHEFAEAAEKRVDNVGKLAARKQINKAVNKLSRKSSEIRKIYDNPIMSASVKRARVDALTDEKNAIADELFDKYWKRF
jgi:hypothetical protein